MPETTKPYVSETVTFELIARNLYTPVIGDILDNLGFFHQFLPVEIKPIAPQMTVVGRAMPVIVGDVFGAQRKPFGRLTEALDQLQPGEIYLAKSGRAQCAAWGEILTATAKMRGASGAVIDGFHRDTPQILSQDWPVFSSGSYAQDSGVRSVVLDYRVPIEIGGVSIQTGDLIVGDRDGVLVIPQAVELEVIERALEKAKAENIVRKAIEGGMSSTDAFEHFGIL
jgi:regulator of RNase E activity RraA